MGFSNSSRGTRAAHQHTETRGWQTKMRSVLECDALGQAVSPLLSPVRPEGVLAAE